MGVCWPWGSFWVGPSGIVLVYMYDKDCFRVGVVRASPHFPSLGQSKRRIEGCEV